MADYPRDSHAPDAVNDFDYRLRDRARGDPRGHRDAVTHPLTNSDTNADRDTGAVPIL